MKYSLNHHYFINNDAEMQSVGVYFWQQLYFECRINWDNFNKIYDIEAGIFITGIVLYRVHNRVVRLVHLNPLSAKPLSVSFSTA